MREPSGNTIREEAMQESFQRREVWDYPLPAIREALLNALIHRDYFINKNPAIVNLQRYMLPCGRDVPASQTHPHRLCAASHADWRPATTRASAHNAPHCSAIA